MALDDALATLFDKLRTEQASVLELLVHPGTDRDEAQAALLEFSGNAPQELVTWFTWMNGLAENDWQRPHRTMLIGRWRPHSLHEAIAATHRYRDQMPPVIRDRLPASWLEICYMEKHRLLVDTAADPTTAPVIVRNFYGDPDANVADSLEGLIHLWLQLFDYGMFWDSERLGWRIASVEGVPDPVLRAAPW